MNDVVAEWGEIATAGKAAGSLGPAWKMFIKTKFFVAIERSPDDDPKNFLLYMDRTGAGEATLIISEQRERLDAALGDAIIPISGTDIVCRIEDEGAIRVLLDGAPFGISKKRVEWLRSGIKMTQERIAIRKRLAAAAPAAPMPVLRTGPEVVPGLKSARSGSTAAAGRNPDTLRQSAGAPTADLLSPDEVLPSTTASAPRSPYVKPAAIGAGVLAVAGIVGALVFGGPRDGVPTPLRDAMPALAAVQAAPSASRAAPAPAAPSQPMMTFTPLDNSFTVSVPGLAEEIELTPDQVSRLGDTRTHQYKLDAGGLLYTMESTDFLVKPPQDRSAEMDAVQNLIIGRDGALIRATPIGLRGATGRDVRVRLPNNGERAARFVFLGSKLCMVAVTAPNGQQAAAQINAFIDSFQLK